MPSPTLFPKTKSTFKPNLLSSDEAGFSSKIFENGLPLNLGDQNFIINYRSFNLATYTLHSGGLYWTYQAFNKSSSVALNRFAQEVLPDSLLSLHPSWNLLFSGGVYTDYLQNKNEMGPGDGALKLDLGFVAALSVYYQWDLFSSMLSVAYKRPFVKDAAVALQLLKAENPAIDLGLDFNLLPDESLHLGLHTQLDPHQAGLRYPAKNLLFQLSWDI